MRKAKYIRKGKTITEIATDKRESFSSINAAKRESRQIQMREDGVLGRGSVKVIRS